MKINRALSIVLVALMLVAMLPTFTFAAGTGAVTISGNSEFVSAPAGTYSKLTYIAAYSDGQAAEVTDPTAFSWGVTKDGAPATDVWCVDGEFIVKGGATGTYNIAATHKETGIKSADFPVVVTASTVYDWSTNVPSGCESVILTDDGDGNKYHNNYTIDYSVVSAFSNGVKTVNLKFKVPAGTNTAGQARIFRPADSDSHARIATISNTSYFTLPEDTFALTYKGGSWLPFCDPSGNVKAIEYDEWYDLSVVFKLPASTSENPTIIGLYLDNEYCITRNATGTKLYEITPWEYADTSKLRFVQPSDDVVMYSGEPYTPQPVIEQTGTIYVPQTAGVKNYVQLSASSIVGSEGITWSIPATPGVSIDANTGLVTVTNEAIAGTVTVTANQYGGSGTANLVLKVISEDFEADGNHGKYGNATGNPWFYSEVASDGNGNQYALNNSNKGFIGRYILDADVKTDQYIDEPSITADGSIVIEFKFKRSEVASRFIFDNIHSDNISLGVHEDWATAKLVYSTPKNPGDAYILNAVVDDKLVLYNHECDENLSFYRFQFQTEAIDDFKMYGADFAAPEAYDVTLSGTVPGSELALSYKYFNEGSVAENGTEIVWSYADSEDSANWTALTAFNNKTAIDAATTATLKGKYVKAVVTPKTVNPYTNEAVAGTPEEAVALIDDVLLSSSCTVDGDSFNIDTDSLAVGKTLSCTFGATQIQDDAVTYMVVAATYTSDGKELLAVDTKDLTTEKGVEKLVTVSATKAEASMIKVFVFKKADFSPAIYKVVK